MKTSKRPNYTPHVCCGQLSIAATILFTSAFAVLGESEEDPREPVIRIVSRVQRADYEGDRVMLKRRYDELAQFLDNKALAARVRYWRGFAMWRRAINGFNDAVDPKELEQDLQMALDEFKEVKETEPGIRGCEDRDRVVHKFAGLHPPERPRTAQGTDRGADTRGEGSQGGCAGQSASSLGARSECFHIAAGAWRRPGESDRDVREGVGAFPEKQSRARTGSSRHGAKPELLMNLAYSNLNKNTPDVNLAERQARAALEHCPLLALRPGHSAAANSRGEGEAEIEKNVFTADDADFTDVSMDRMRSDVLS